MADLGTGTGPCLLLPGPVIRHHHPCYTRYKLPSPAHFSIVPLLSTMLSFKFTTVLSVLALAVLAAAAPVRSPSSSYPLVFTDSVAI